MAVITAAGLTPHEATHDLAGSDNIATLGTHATRHNSGGADQITFPANPVTVEASDDTEYSTVSTTDVTLVTKSGLNIPVTKTIRLVFNFRKTSGAAAAFSFALSLNGTQLHPTQAITAGTNGVANGVADIVIGARATNYELAEKEEYTTGGASFTILPTTNMPIATITSIAFLGKVGSGITGAISNIRIYSMS